MLLRWTRSWSSRPGRCPFTADGLLAVADLIDLWVPKTCVTWADPLRERGWFGQALSVSPADLGSAGGGMIFGLWA